MRRTVTAMIALIVLVIASMAPAAAQTAESARAEAWGAQITGLVDLGPLPDPVVAEVPPGEQDSDSFLEVPAEPAVFSGTLSGDVEAARDNVVQARLQSVMQGASSATLPNAWNSGAHAITEDLAVLMTEEGGDLEIPEELSGLVDEILGEGGFDDILGELGDDATVAQEQAPLLTAEVVESEAVAACTDGDPVFATGSRVQQLQLAGEPVPVLDEILGTVTELVVQGEPNEDVLANLDAAGELLSELGLEIIAWETNWDSADGTTDGSDTVWANALRVSVTEGSPLGDVVGAQDVTVSHSEASVSDCDGEVDPGGPLRDVSKESSVDTVAPGDTFTYTITVPNSGTDCTLENVNVVDTITGPAGSEITATDPEADDIDDLTVTWNDVGPIAPGEQVTLTVEIQVPSDAQDGDMYSESVNISADCDGEPVEGGVDFDGPEVVDADVKPGEPGTEPVADRGPLPETGGGATLAGLLLLGGGALAAGLRRRLT